MYSGLFRGTRKIGTQTMDEAKEKQLLCVTAWFESESSSDDSDADPSFCVLEETRAKFSSLAIKKKAKARVVEEIGNEIENVEPGLNEVDEKSFEEVQRIILAGQIEKLKVEQCKVYLRKSGLRLTGNKATLIQRIREHLEVVNGGGERKYTASSFVMNCKGDACTGDVVLFEQNIYDKFNIASRSASGPPCGTRMVAGRIVKESYGAAKQQHTFTIEVLWSKGEQPLPPLHPLLIKGRNLYRLKTLRQKWEDEGERQNILMEKHSRGFLARSDREARIQEKEKRKMLRENRISNKEAKGNKNQSQFESTLVPKPSAQPQNLGLLVNSRNTDNQAIRPRQSGFSSKPATEAHQAGSVANPGTQPQAKNPGLYVDYDNVTTKSQIEKDTIQYKYINQPSRSLVENRSLVTSERTYPGIREVMHTSNQLHSHKKGINFYSGDHMNWTREFPERTTYRQPFTSMNKYGRTSPSRREYCAPQKLCHYYPQGRCYYGERCKFSHVIQEECEQRREERWPHDQSRA